MGTLWSPAKELRRVQVLSRVERGERKLAEAAELLELSYRQAKRLEKRYSAAGSKALVRGNVGRASNRADDKRRERGSNGNERFPTLPLEIAPAIPTFPQPRRRLALTNQGTCLLGLDLHDGAA